MQYGWYRLLKGNPTCVVIDCETNGLRRKNNFPRMVQFAWSIVSLVEGSIVRKSYISFPEGFVPNPTGDLKHGITFDLALSKGRKIQDILQEFSSDLGSFNVTVCIAHNVSFDAGIILNELRLASLPREYFEGMKKLCTMEATVQTLKLQKTRYKEQIARRVNAYKEHLNLRSSRHRRRLQQFKKNLEEDDKRWKYPKLTELYSTLTGKQVENWHNALADMIACETCFLILARQWIAEGVEEDKKAAVEKEKREAEALETKRRKEEQFRALQIRRKRERDRLILWLLILGFGALLIAGFALFH